MADKEYDPWHFTTGFAEAYRGKVLDSYFTFDSEYQDGTALLLKLEILTDDPEIGESGKITEQYPVGKDWEPKDKGLRAAHNSGKAKNLNKNGGVAQLCQAAVEAGAGETLQQRGGAEGPLNAGIWKGLDFDFERKEYSGTFGGEKQTWARMLPVKYHGETGSAPVPAQAPTQAAPPASVPVDESVSRIVSGGTPAAVNGGVSPILRAKLINLAKEAQTHDQFMEVAFGVDGVMGNNEVEQAVADDGAGSIWATAKS